VGVWERVGSNVPWALLSNGADATHGTYVIRSVSPIGPIRSSRSARPIPQGATMPIAPPNS